MNECLYKIWWCPVCGNITLISKSNFPFLSWPFKCEECLENGNYVTKLELPEKVNEIIKSTTRYLLKEDLVEYLI